MGMLHIDLTKSDRELTILITSRCSEFGTVRSVKIHRRPTPFALVEMATHEEVLELAAYFERTVFGTSVLLHLEQPNKKT